jgi:hypothetical protein
VDNIDIFNFIAIWDILSSFGIFFDDLLHFGVLWYIFPVLVCCAKENLATQQRKNKP